MQHPQVCLITLSVPITAIGKIYTGDYGKAQQYIMNVMELLAQKNILFMPNKVMGVYYDDPTRKKAEELTSFQGVFPANGSASVADPLIEMRISGSCLYTKVSGDPAKSIYEGYSAIFDFIRENNVTLKSTIGYQVSTFENGVITTEIYMQTL